MPEILFTGNGLDSVSTTNAVTEDNRTFLFDSTRVNCALSCDGVGQSWTARCIDLSGNDTTVTTGQTFFGHFEAYRSNGDTSGNNLSWLEDSSGVAWVALRYNGTNYGIYYNSGTAGSPVWTQVGASTTPIPIGSLLTFDWRLTLGSPHTVELYVGGNLVISGTFTQASFTNIAKMGGRGVGGQFCFYSQIMVTEGISTVGAKVLAKVATGAGASNTMSGAYTDINEVPISDATVLSSATPGQKATLAYADATVPAGFAIKSVFLFSRGKNDGSSPTNLRPVCRSGGVDYSPANYNGISLGYKPLGYPFKLNPDGNVAWTQATFNAAEWGAESAA